MTAAIPASTVADCVEAARLVRRAQALIAEKDTPAHQEALRLALERRDATLEAFPHDPAPPV